MQVGSGPGEIRARCNFRSIGNVGLRLAGGADEGEGAGRQWPGRGCSGEGTRYIGLLAGGSSRGWLGRGRCRRPVIGWGIGGLDCGFPRDGGPHDARTRRRRSTFIPGSIIAKPPAYTPRTLVSMVGEHKLSDLVATVDLLPRVVDIGQRRALRRVTRAGFL